MNCVRTCKCPRCSHTKSVIQVIKNAKDAIGADLERAVLSGTRSLQQQNHRVGALQKLALEVRCRASAVGRGDMRLLSLCSNSKASHESEVGDTALTTVPYSPGIGTVGIIVLTSIPCLVHFVETGFMSKCMYCLPHATTC